MYSAISHILNASVCIDFHHCSEKMSPGDVVLTLSIKLTFNPVSLIIRQKWLAYLIRPIESVFIC